MTAPPLGEMTREEICAELNQAESGDVIALAAACVAGDAALVITRPPTVGTVVTQVREPVAEQRFILADVLACQAEVTLHGHQGWAMRMGSDRMATLAAAICAAEFEANGPYAAEIVALCHAGRQRRKENRSAEWERLAPTIVEFEEIP
ncbi:phosphonate C-P lyase system protein PhnG [Actinopolymorpha pittospori]|uniref:Alpha-D-ribose 1-methylphosphonate 5-triphosphate synthase subunit PhnG n=1 Tax=Actinopolymorpha pittospori TaxID=648752 RepID=A0A927N5W6_9ACTN|nr:phosphonate C-P lyase system protein PhnG [Actinopolymorpha pittospori]MBE1609085.1 alpha-D-ribose 1-methylphosphonate 5-triphosphate synthase subunit PhnG [Actinopolymorpha pittospori]